MFGPGFVTDGIEPAAAGNPAVIASPVTWASHVMLGHVVVCNLFQPEEGLQQVVRQKSMS
jgi:hypothetical protein